MVNMMHECSTIASYLLGLHSYIMTTKEIAPQSTMRPLTAQITSNRRVIGDQVAVYIPVYPLGKAVSNYRAPDGGCCVAFQFYEMPMSLVDSK